MICLDRETAAAYLNGDLEPAEAEEITVHMAECSGCRALVENVSEMIDRVRRTLLFLDVPLPSTDLPAFDLSNLKMEGIANRFSLLPSFTSRILKKTWNKSPVAGARPLKPWRSGLRMPTL